MDPELLKIIEFNIQKDTNYYFYGRIPMILILIIIRFQALLDISPEAYVTT